MAMDELLSRQLPQAVEAEQAVIGSMLIDPSCIPEVIELLRPEDFYAEENRRIFETIFSMFTDSIRIDAVTVLNELKMNGLYDDAGGRAYLAQLMDVTPTAAGVREYAHIIRSNKPLQRLMIAGGGCKLALSIATNLSVLCMIYGCMTQFGVITNDAGVQVSQNRYDVINATMMVLGYVFSAPFFLLTVKTAQKHGQKQSLMKYVSVALLCYIGVLAMLLIWQPENPARNLILLDQDGKFAINLYTIAFILFFGVGYGSYYATADMPIPMVADCADYETYRSGKFIPGIMGTLFSLVDKLVSSLSASVVALVVGFIGIHELPTKSTPYAPGMNWVVIVLFCLIPMLAWILTLWAMKGYELDGKRVEEIQAVNNARKAYIAQGHTLEQAMDTIKTTEDAEKYQTTGGKTAAM